MKFTELFTYYPRRATEKLFHLGLSLFPSLRKKVKERNELGYWKMRKRKDPALANDFYEYFYTTHFGLSKDFYAGKKILDIGCGPAGTLEWAMEAGERIGLDPLAEKYLALGANTRGMKYVALGAESIPYPDNYFDVVCSFNSIDHVDDLDKVISEIKRVLKHAGTFLLITDIHPEPTFYEPQVFGFDLVKRFEPEFRVISENHYERGTGVYMSLTDNRPFDHSNSKPRYGVLVARMEKP